MPRKPGLPSHPTLTRELLARYLAGDLEAERRLFERYRPHLLQRVRAHRNYRALSRRFEPEDMVHEVFLRALSRGTFDTFEDRGQGSLGKLLETILQNTLVDFGRRGSALKRGESSAPSSLEGTSESEGGWSPRSPEPTPTSNARHKDLIDFCRLTLNEREWTVWEMHKMRGLTDVEVGEALGETPSTVRSVVSRAKQKLAQALLED